MEAVMAVAVMAVAAKVAATVAAKVAATAAVVRVAGETEVDSEEAATVEGVMVAAGPKAEAMAEATAVADSAVAMLVAVR